jgi:hypothetical protein
MLYLKLYLINEDSGTPTPILKKTNGIGEAFSRNTFGAEKHLVWLIISNDWAATLQYPREPIDGDL